MSQNPYTPGDAELSSGDTPKTGGILSILKKVMIAFGVIFLLIILLFIWVWVSTSNTKGKFDEIVDPFVNGFLIDQSPWDYEKAKPHLSDAWFEVVTEEQGVDLFKIYNKLGAFESLESLTWQGCNNSVDASSGSIERCNYVASTNYENGHAQIQMGLLLEAENIKIIHLKVVSDVFIQ